MGEVINLSDLKLKYKIIKIGRNVAETTSLLNKYYACGWKLVTSYMNGDHLILEKMEDKDE